MKCLILIFATISALGCATASKGDHERAMLHLQIGTGYLSSGNYPLAMSELLKAESMDPKNPLILNNLGLAFYVRGKLKQAEEKFRAAIHSEGGFSDAKNNLARVLIDTGRPGDAVKVLREVEADLTYQF